MNNIETKQTDSANESHCESVPESKGVPPVDLSAPGVKKAVAQRVKADVDKYCEETYDDGHRTHLGASKIGEDCARALWYGFRWVSAEKFNGRMQRLFQRGHREEPYVFEHLRGAGFQIFEFDESLPLKDGQPQQYRFSAACGHFGGSLDAVCKLPAHYNIAEPMLVSVKTNATGGAFNDLGTDGVKVVKPVHYAQECVYGRAFGLKYALYVYRNKNDDDQHIEIVELDHKHAEQLEMKAERIIFSREAPPRISENPAFKTCKFCWFGNDKTGICFKKSGHTPIDRNCRSCKNAVPGENKTWNCDIHSRTNGPLPAKGLEAIAAQCTDYDPIV